MVNFATLYIAPVHFPYSIAYISTQQNNNKQKHNIQMANIKDQQKRTESADALNKKEALFLKHKKTISIVIIAIILIVTGVLCYNTYISGPRDQKASTALATGQQYFADKQYDKALNGDGAGFAGFAAIASDYSNTDAGNLANLYAGLCYANLGKWENAVKFLDEYSPADDQMISPAAIAALGNAYAHVKQYDKAVSSLKKAAKMADSEAAEGVNNSLSPTFLLQAAEILESQNDKAGALEIYKNIKTKYVNSPISGEIDKYIERAEAE